MIPSNGPGLRVEIAFRPVTPTICTATRGSRLGRLMPRQPRHREGEVVGGWTLLDNLGVGGNGEAWRALKGGDVRVIKLLHPGVGDRYDRFRREVKAVQELVPTGFAALPILEAHLPDAPSRTAPAFYVMPEAVPLAEALAGRDVREKIGAVRELEG